MPTATSVALGVVVRCCPLRSRWQSSAWRAVAVIPGAPVDPGWRALAYDRALYLAATLPLSLHRSDTPSYRVNLASEPPSVYVVLRRVASEDRPGDVQPFLVTAAPDEAEAYLTGDDQVDPVPMPASVVAWVQHFIDVHHVEDSFVKRQRDDAVGRPPGR